MLCLYLYLLLFIILNLNLLTDGRNKHDDETREHWNAVSDSVKQKLSSQQQKAKVVIPITLKTSM